MIWYDFYVEHESRIYKVRSSCDPNLAHATKNCKTVCVDLFTGERRDIAADKLSPPLNEMEVIALVAKKHSTGVNKACG